LKSINRGNNILYLKESMIFIMKYNKLHYNPKWLKHLKQVNFRNVTPHVTNMDNFKRFRYFPTTPPWKKLDLYCLDDWLLFGMLFVGQKITKDNYSFLNHNNDFLKLVVNISHSLFKSLVVFFQSFHHVVFHHY